jgi:transcriptional regulator with XRE-family HTH domain
MNCKALLISELKARRQALGWSLTEVGERCGIEERFLGDWERGDGSPRLDAVDTWATALGLKLAVASTAETPRRGLSIDWDNRCVSVDGAPVRLTPMEWKALERLAAAPGELVTHQALFRHLYGEERPYNAQSTAIRVLITKLRRLLPLRIDAQWGRGYVVVDINPSSPCSDIAGKCDSPPPTKPLIRHERTRSSHVAHQSHQAHAAPRSPTRLMQELVERSEPAIRRPIEAPVCFLPHRAEELQVIERFLAERGATRCPDVATIERAPLPTLIWDKAKRKWVRPTGTNAAAG